jgi:hypothetical protein
METVALVAVVMALTGVGFVLYFYFSDRYEKKHRHA